MNILLYVLKVFNYLFYCISRFKKEKHQILYIDIISKLFVIASLWVFNSMSGVYMVSIQLLLLFVVYYKTKKNKKWNIGFILSMIALLTIALLQYEGISTILMLLSSICIIIGNWYLKPQHMRLIGIVASCFYLAYCITIKNYVGVLEIFVIISNISAYKMYLKDKKYN